MATITGDGGNNSFVAAAATSDYFEGNGGNDTISAGAGNDSVFGGTGRDSLLGGDGNDRLFGGDNADSIYGDGGNDTLYGGTDGGAGDDSLFGGLGFDFASYENLTTGVNVNLFNGTASGEGTDFLASIEGVIGGIGADTITGDTLGNILFGQEGADQLYGGDGNDTLEGGLGADSLTGGNGVDTASYSTSNAAVNVNLNNATGHTGGHAAGDSITGIENLEGSFYNDTLTGNGNANAIDGAEGNDTISGQAGDDTLTGGIGNDTLAGGTGNDLIYAGPEAGTTGSGAPVNLDMNWSLQGGAGTNLAGGFTQNTGGINVQIGYASGVGNQFIVENDAIYVAGGETFSTTSSGFLNRPGAGTPTTVTMDFSPVSGSGFANEVQNVAFRISDIDLQAWTDQVIIRAYDANGNLVPVTITETSSEITVTGDTIVATGDNTEPNQVDGSVLITVAGPVARIEVEYSNLNASNQYIYVSDVQFQAVPVVDNDSVNGGDGNDSIYGGIGNDTLLGEANDDLLFGGAGNDNLNGGVGADSLVGGDGNDILIGLDGSDSLVGDAGDDTLNGGIDSDRLFGGAGNDSLVGDAGDDSIDGGADNDTIFGGAGADSIDGGTGSDSIIFGSGDDTVLGGDGNDFIDDNVGGNETGANLVYGGEGNDTIWTGGGTDTVFGDAGNDVINAEDGADSVFGGTGNDTIDGGAEADSIDAGADRDQVFGGTGEDRIIGGSGTDSLYGGSDNDRFVYTGTETFTFSDSLTPEIVDGGGTVVGPNVPGDFDTIDLTAYGWDRIVISPTGPEEGYIYIYTDATETTLLGVIRYTEIEEILPCFTPGTMILTDRGEVAVEDLCAGDLVMTRDNGLQPIRWVGRRKLSALDLQAQPDLQPVRIAQGAFAGAGPVRSMLVSPQHRVLVEGARAELLFGEAEVLVPAKHLVGLAEVTRAAPTEGVTYVHLLFDRHEIVQSDGIWTESFQPAERMLNAMDEEVRAEIVALFPQLEQGTELFPGARLSLKAHEARVLFAAE